MKNIVKKIILGSIVANLTMNPVHGVGPSLDLPGSDKVVESLLTRVSNSTNEEKIVAVSAVVGMGALLYAWWNYSSKKPSSGSVDEKKPEDLTEKKKDIEEGKVNEAKVNEAKVVGLESNQANKLLDSNRRVNRISYDLESLASASTSGRSIGLNGISCVSMSGDEFNEAMKLVDTIRTVSDLDKALRKIPRTIESVIKELNNKKLDLIDIENMSNRGTIVDSEEVVNKIDELNAKLSTLEVKKKQCEIMEYLLSDLKKRKAEIVGQNSQVLTEQQIFTMIQNESLFQAYEKSKVSISHYPDIQNSFDDITPENLIADCIVQLEINTDLIEGIEKEFTQGGDEIQINLTTIMDFPPIADAFSGLNSEFNLRKVHRHFVHKIAESISSLDGQMLLGIMQNLGIKAVITNKTGGGHVIRFEYASGSESEFSYITSKLNNLIGWARQQGTSGPIDATSATPDIVVQQGDRRKRDF